MFVSTPHTGWVLGPESNAVQTGLEHPNHPSCHGERTTFSLDETSKMNILNKPTHATCVLIPIPSRFPALFLGRVPYWQSAHSLLRVLTLFVQHTPTSPRYPTDHCLHPAYAVTSLT